MFSACQVKVDVRVSSAPDGSGTVRVTATLDKDATAQAGALALDDLKQTGWTVSSVDHDGSRVVTATHGFETSADLGVLMTEVGEPFNDFRLQTRRSLLETRTDLTGTVDLRAGLAAFSDADLQAKLGGPGIGLDPSAVRDATGVDLDKVLDLTVTVAIPGQTVSRHPALGQVTTLAARASHYNTRTIVYLVLAGVAALAALALLLRRRRSA